MKPNKSHQTKGNLQNSDNKSGNCGERTLALLQKIQSGALDPKCIRPAERCLIVSYLMADGYCTAEIAQVLKISERSIERDKKSIREANALDADPQLTEKMAGRLVFEAELSIQRIRKAIRDKNTKAVVKIDAEHRCYQIFSDMICSMQRLGYLPTATARLQADLTHHVDQIPELSQMQQEVQRLKKIRVLDSTAKKQLLEIETELKKVKLADKIDNFSKTVESRQVQDDED